ncbi:cell division cycle- protein [Globomyces sp. JEL0801]|nr:cell division cycle- protein [Globomyces sp. JEL0801]
MLLNSVPHSPDNDTILNLPHFATLFNSKSPVSLLSCQLDHHLAIDSNRLSAKTPRRCLLPSLSNSTDTPASIHTDLMLCDSPDSITNGLSLSPVSLNSKTSFIPSSPLCASSVSSSVINNGSAHLSFVSNLCLEKNDSLSGFDHPQNDMTFTSKRSLGEYSKIDGIDNSMSGQTELKFHLQSKTNLKNSTFKSPIISNPFNDDELCQSPTLFKKIPLKFPDQNCLKPPRPCLFTKKSMKLSHWNSRKSVKGAKQHSLNVIPMSSKRREMDQSPLAESRDGSPANLHPRKIRRSLTFGGVDSSAKNISSVMHPVLADDPFCKSPEPLLPSFLVKKDMIRRINVETLVDIIEGKYQDLFDEFHLMDCRYPYEYNGGHVNGAKNVTSVSDIESMFFSTPSTKRTVIVFHCEYSIQRAPQMYF